MRNYGKPSASSKTQPLRRRSRVALLSVASACLALGGCQDKIIVTELVAGPPVPEKLLQKSPQPKCDYDSSAETVPPAVLDASRTCWKADSTAIRSRFGGLASAVRVRDKAVAEAIAAGNAAKQ